MKKIIFFSFFSILLISSCSKNADNSIVTGKNATVDNLTNSAKFIELVKTIGVLDEHIAISRNSSLLSKEQARNLLTANTITENQLTVLSQYYGFERNSDFIDIFNSQDKIVKQLKVEFQNISTISIDTLQEAIGNIQYNLQYNKYKVSFENPDDVCKQIFDNCMKGASAGYIKDILSCTAAAIGVGALTGGIGGVIFQLACGAASYSALSTARESCTLAFNNCKL